MRIYPQPDQRIEVSLGSVFGAVPDGPSIDITDMDRCPERDEWNDYGIYAGKYATPIIVMLDVDTDDSDLFTVAMQHDDGHHRL